MNDARWSDRRMVLWMGAVILLLIIAVSVLAPDSADDDARPTSYNNGPQGAKAAFLMLQAIGRTPSRWQRPIGDLSHVDASHTTLVLAAPVYSPTDQEAIAAAVKSYLERGGRVLTTGPTGALLLPGGKIEPPTTFMVEMCHTYPGAGPLAAAGRVAMVDRGAWAGKEKVEIAHRCGQDAVVVRMPVGRGEAVWWSSAVPLTNAELKTDADLRLLLLSLGEGRTILWDESLHETVPGLWDAARGLPIGWLIVQVVLLGGIAGAELQPQEWAVACAGHRAEEFADRVCVVDGRSLREGARDHCSDRCSAAQIAARDCARGGRATGDRQRGTEGDCERIERAAGWRLDNCGRASREGERGSEGEPDLSRGAGDLAGIVGGCREDSRCGAQRTRAGCSWRESGVVMQFMDVVFCEER